MYLKHPHLCNDKGEQDGLIILMKFKDWDGTQDMGALFDANFKTSLPATEADILNLTKPNEKVQDNARKLKALGMGILALVM